MGGSYKLRPHMSICSNSHGKLLITHKKEWSKDNQNCGWNNAEKDFLKSEGEVEPGTRRWTKGRVVTRLDDPTEDWAEEFHDELRVGRSQRRKFLSIPQNLEPGLLSKGALVTPRDVPYSR